MIKLKRLVPIFIFCIALVLVVVLSACGGEKTDSSEQIDGVILVDGAKEGQNIGYTYSYGDTLDFVNTLKMYIKYNDGRKVELTEEQYRSVSVSYNLQDGTKIDELSSGVILDAGRYYISFKYDNYDASIDLLIELVDLPNVDNYTYTVKTASGSPVASTKYGTGNIDTDTQEYTSNYVVSLKNGNNYITQDMLQGIYAITEEEYNEYNQLTDKEAKDTYLNNHKSISTGPDSAEWRSVTYNSSCKEGGNNEFYLYDSVEPGTYYMFAEVVPIKNYNATLIYPNQNSKLVITKGDYNLADAIYDANGEYTYQQIKDQLDIHATFTYGTYYINNVEYKVTGTITLGDIYEIGYFISGLDYNTTNERIQMTFAGAGGNIGTFGHFEFANSNLQVNSNSSTANVKAKYVLYEYYAKYYNNSNELFDMTLTINKGQVGKPYVFEGDENKEYEYYFGESIDFENKNIGGQDNGGVLRNFDHDYVQLVQGSQSLTQSAVGTYHAKLQLIDPENYVFMDEMDNCYYGEAGLDANDKPYQDFTWKIVKRDIGVLDYKVSYNGVDVYDPAVPELAISNPTISYVRGVHTVTVTLFSDAYSRYITNREFTYSYVINDFCVDIESTGFGVDDYIATSNYTHSFNWTAYNGAEIPAYAYLELFITASADDNFEAFNMNNNAIRIYFEPGQLTTEETTSLLSGISTDYNAQTGYSLLSAVVVTKSGGIYTISDNIIPTNDLQGSGEWGVFINITINDNIIGQKLTFSAGSATIPSNMLSGLSDIDNTLENNARLMIIFIPNDTCMDGLVITATLAVVES